MNCFFIYIYIFLYTRISKYALMFHFIQFTSKVRVYARVRRTSNKNKQTISLQSNYKSNTKLNKQHSLIFAACARTHFVMWECECGCEFFLFFLNASWIIVIQCIHVYKSICARDRKLIRKII